MFTELPKLFDRNFAIGYFLPSAIFLSATIYLLSKFKIRFLLIPEPNFNILLTTTVFGVVVWLISIFLLALNRDIYRFLEGYGALNPIRLFIGIERFNYRKISRKLAEINTRLEKVNSRLKELENFKDKELGQKELTERDNLEAETNKLAVLRGKLMREKVERFPDEEVWLLPTSFGNTIRAFETYSRVMYGLDSISGWERLLTVIPKDYRTFIDDAKVQADFWVNSFMFTILFILIYLYACIHTKSFQVFWVVLLAILTAYITFLKSTSAALEWGNYIKASFDVFLPELYNKLGFNSALTRDEERENWTRFSQAIIYRHKKYIHNRSSSGEQENRGS